MSFHGLRIIGACLLLIVVDGLRGEEPGCPVRLRPTELILGPEDDPRAVVWLSLERPLASEATITVKGPGPDELHRVSFPRNEASAVRLLPVSLPEVEGASTVELVVREPAQEGASPGSWTVTTPLPRPDETWTIHFVPGFHYDPVWWNTQAHYTETGKYMDADVGPGLTLVEAYLDLCQRDPDYRLALHQLPYLKTFFEARPWLSSRILDGVKEGRVAAVGGTYNELSTTLVSAEACIRNAAYGMSFLQSVLGGGGEIFWQCDVFGHDPSFPGIMARSGHRYGVFGRGPFHQWGAPREEVNFPSEFVWMSPDGSSVLTHYMTGHYGYAYEKLASGRNEAPGDPELRRLIIAEMFEDLRRPALTHHVLLPLHKDFVRPLTNLGDAVRDWNRTFVSPRAIIDTGREFFAAVRAEIEERDLVPPVITRDMNPIYTGCPVSLADLKLAQRAVESALRDAEILATVASLEGATYPSASLDRAWRQILFNSHHDGVTGSQSDQVYLDTLASYRDAHELATGVRDRAIDYLTGLIGTRDATNDETIVAWNTTARKRDGWVEVDVKGGERQLLVAGVPAVGYRTYSFPGAVEVSTPGNLRTLENEYLLAEIDLEKGGTLSRLYDKRNRRELLTGPGNDVVLHEEYSVLPGHGEGPWHLAPTGKSRAGTGVEATLEPFDPDHPDRRVIVAHHPEFTKRQTIELHPGSRRIEFTTQILGWKGRDQLLRVEFPLNVPGARPVFQTAAAVIGRPFARDTDSARDPWTLDQTCWHWIDYGTTCVLEVADGDEVVHRRALGVGEIVIPDDAGRGLREKANELARLLVRRGVTTTITEKGGRRYGDLELDSNVPDFRILLEGRGRISYHEGSDGLPLLRVPPGVAWDDIVAQLGVGARVRIPASAATLEDPDRVSAADWGVALLNRGPISARISESSVLGLNLLRSSTGWPSGVWIDPPSRRQPDGAPFGTMHGSHRFEYALVVHDGDYRAAHLAEEGQESNQPVLARTTAPASGRLPAEASFFAVEGRDVLLTALKPAGFPEARWSQPVSEVPARSGWVVARLWNGSGEKRSGVLTSRYGILRAFRTDLLERRLGTIELVEGGVPFELEPHEQLSLLLGLVPAERDGEAPRLDPTDGEASPSAYWLENLGEGVHGNGVVALVPERREVVVATDGAFFDLHVVHQRAEGTIPVRLDVGAAEDLVVDVEPRVFELAPRSTRKVRVRVKARDGAIRRSCLTFSARVHERRSVTGCVWLGPEGSELDDGGAGVEIDTLERIVSVGGSLRATIRNTTPGPIRGTASWMTSMRLWEATPDWRTEVALAPGEEVEVSCPLTSAVDSFAILKFSGGGRIAYGETIAITADPRGVVLSFGVDRVRLNRGAPTPVEVVARSLRGLGAESRVTLEAGGDLSVETRGTGFRAGIGGAQELVTRFLVQADPEKVRGTLRARGPAGAVVPVAYTVTPRQLARPASAAVAIDGDLGEWSEEEFTEATGPLGVMRTAVRYGAAGLAIAVEVKDEKYVQTRTGAKIWEGDSIQFAISRTPSTALGYATTDLEFGAALTAGGPMVWCWYGGEDGGTGRVEKAVVEVRREENRLVYEMLVPGSVLPRVSLSPGTTLGFSYIANDDDGEGYRGATQWTPGMVGGKDSSLFGELHLLKD